MNSWDEIRKVATAFSKRWRNAFEEKSQAVSINGEFHIPCYDHNGNIVRYVSEAGTTSASYTYDPYGTVVEAEGPLADVFSFGFSTKYHDRETGLVAYQQRFYHPPNGRWLNRDPIEERGGVNLYAFCENNPIYEIDSLGENLFDIHARRIRDFLQMGNEEMAAGEAFLLYQEIAMGGTILEPLAAQLLNYWLKGSGRTYTIPSQHVKRAMLYDRPEGNSPKKQLTDRLCAATAMNAGSLSGYRIDLTATEGTYYHAFGSFTIFFSGTYKCRKGEFKFTGNWDFEDTYDWHNGLSANVLGTEIEDSWANLVKEYKGANDFDEKGSWNGTINVKCSSSGKEGGRR